jgi:DNA-binding NtrC family response regulator
LLTRRRCLLHLCCRLVLKGPDFGTDTGAMATPTSRLTNSSTRQPDAGEPLSGRVKGIGQILVVDDERPLLRSLARILEADSQHVTLADDPERLDAVLDDPALDVILVDLVMGRTSGLDVLERVKRERPEVEVIVMTGHASIESAVGCMRSGAFDYLQKPFDDVHRVRTTVRKAVERRCLLRRNRELEEELRGRDAVSGLIGSSPPIRAVLRAILSLRHNESSVVIRGESGTGKELAARALHATSPRSDGPFVTVDCGAIPAATRRARSPMPLAPRACFARPTAGHSSWTRWGSCRPASR